MAPGDRGGVGRRLLGELRNSGWHHRQRGTTGAGGTRTATSGAGGSTSDKGGTFGAAGTLGATTGSGGSGGGGSPTGGRGGAVAGGSAVAGNSGSAGVGGSGTGGAGGSGTAAGGTSGNGAVYNPAFVEFSGSDCQVAAPKDVSISGGRGPRSTGPGRSGPAVFFTGSAEPDAADEEARHWYVNKRHGRRTLVAVVAQATAPRAAARIVAGSPPQA